MSSSADVSDTSGVTAAAEGTFDMSIKDVEVLASMFEAADTDGDGYVDKEEFREMWKKRVGDDDMGIAIDRSDLMWRQLKRMTGARADKIKCALLRAAVMQAGETEDREDAGASSASLSTFRHIRKVFRQFDNFDNGSLFFVEFVQLVKYLYPRASTEEISHAFEAIDRDESGDFEYETRLAMLQAKLNNYQSTPNYAEFLHAVESTYGGMERARSLSAKGVDMADDPLEYARRLGDDFKHHISGEELDVERVRLLGQMMWSWISRVGMEAVADNVRINEEMEGAKDEAKFNEESLTRERQVSEQLQTNLESVCLRFAAADEECGLLRQRLDEALLQMKAYVGDVERANEEVNTMAAAYGEATEELSRLSKKYESLKPAYRRVQGELESANRILNGFKVDNEVLRVENERLKRSVARLEGQQMAESTSSMSRRDSIELAPGVTHRKSDSSEDAPAFESLASLEGTSSAAAQDGGESEGDGSEKSWEAADGSGDEARAKGMDDVGVTVSVTSPDGTSKDDADGAPVVARVPAKESKGSPISSIASESGSSDHLKPRQMSMSPLVMPTPVSRRFSFDVQPVPPFMTGPMRRGSSASVSHVDLASLTVDLNAQSVPVSPMGSDSDRFEKVIADKVDSMLAEMRAMLSGGVVVIPKGSAVTSGEAELLLLKKQVASQTELMAQMLELVRDGGGAGERVARSASSANLTVVHSAEAHPSFAHGQSDSDVSAVSELSRLSATSGPFVDADPLVARVDELCEATAALFDVTETATQCVSSLAEECAHVVAGMHGVRADSEAQARATSLTHDTLATLVAATGGVADAIRDGWQAGHPVHAATGTEEEEGLDEVKDGEGECDQTGVAEEPAPPGAVSPAVLAGVSTQLRQAVAHLSGAMAVIDGTAKCESEGRIEEPVDLKEEGHCRESGFVEERIRGGVESMEQVGDVADADAPPLLIASQIGALSQVAESSAQCVSAMTEECGHVVSGLSDVYAETTQLRETLAQLVSVMVGMSDAERAQTQTQEVDSAELSRQLSVQTALIAQVFEIVKEGDPRREEEGAGGEEGRTATILTDIATQMKSDLREATSELSQVVSATMAEECKQLVAEARRVELGEVATGELRVLGTQVALQSEMMAQVVEMVKTGSRGGVAAHGERGTETEGGQVVSGVAAERDGEEGDSERRDGEQLPAGMERMLWSAPLRELSGQVAALCELSTALVDSVDHSSACVAAVSRECERVVGGVALVLREREARDEREAHASDALDRLALITVDLASVVESVGRREEWSEEEEGASSEQGSVVGAEEDDEMGELAQLMNELSHAISDGSERLRLVDEKCQELTPESYCATVETEEESDEEWRAAALSESSVSDGSGAREEKKRVEDEEHTPSSARTRCLRGRGLARTGHADYASLIDRAIRRAVELDAKLEMHFH